ncbi:MAG TPA: HNH endonuclease [Vicinamibacterales bacterium]|nr:HNH endonuclease [Vicinamibacterales bacterium]
MTAIPKGLGPYRRCKQCERSFRDRGAGSGVKRSLCSVECEQAEKRGKAAKAANAKRARQQRTRQGAGGETRGWPATVFELYGTDCLSCGARAQQAHHIVPKQVIRRRPYVPLEVKEQLLYDPANGFPICTRCHEKHELAVERLYFSMLPSPAVEWAVANGFATRVFDDRVYIGAPDLEAAA